jgi:hypothetical protein
MYTRNKQTTSTDRNRAIVTLSGSKSDKQSGLAVLIGLFGICVGISWTNLLITGAYQNEKCEDDTGYNCFFHGCCF